MFFRAQTSAVVATAIDFLVMMLCFQVLGLPLAFAVAAGPISGGLVNFFLNRRWSFNAHREGIGWQIYSYMLVCLIAAAANVVGVLALVAYFALDYLLARILVAMVVALAINYPLHRRVVFVTSGRFVSDD